MPAEAKPLIRNTDFLKYPRIAFRIIGVEFEERGNCAGGRWAHLCSMGTFCLAYSNLNLALVGEVCFFALNYESVQSYLEATDVLSFISLFALSEIKVWKIYQNRSVLHPLMRAINDIFPDKNAGQQKSHKVEFYYKRIVFGIMLPLTVFTFASVWVVVFMPLIKSTKEFIKTGMFVKRLPFLIWYPFDATGSSLSYVVVYSHQIYAGFIAGTSLLSSDLLLCYIMLQVCMQFSGIIANLKEMQPSPDGARARQNVRALNEIIKHHNSIMELAKDINIIFRVTVFINFLSATGVMCFSGFQIKEGLATDEIIRYTLVLMYMLMQVLIFSYVGNRLKEMSSQVGDAAYAQNWTDGCAEYRRMLVLVMARSQKPSTLQGITTNSVDLSDFSTVISTAYRFFAVLNSVYSKSSTIEN